MPPKKASGTSKSKAKSTPKAPTRTTRGRQTQEEIVVKPPGEKEQPINPDDEESGLNEEEETDHTLADQVLQLREHGTDLENAVNDIRDQLHIADRNHQTLDSKLENILAYLQDNPHRNEDSSINSPRRETRSGNSPTSVLAEHLSWIDNDQTFLNNIVHGKMEVKDLLKLIPEEDRPKGRKLTHAGFLLDTSGTITTVDESTAFEKDFPNFELIIYALTMYGAIRSLFDVDHTGISTAIFIHIKNLTRWYRINGFPLSAIRSYFIAHFRKHQRSKDPSVWNNTDFELHANYIRHSAPQFLQPTRPTSPSKIPRIGSSTDVCINFNTEGKGCTWVLCQRKHVCSNCGDNKHSKQQCSKKLPVVKP